MVFNIIPYSMGKTFLYNLFIVILGILIQIYYWPFFELDIIKINIFFAISHLGREKELIWEN